MQQNEMTGGVSLCMSCHCAPCVCKSGTLSDGTGPAPDTSPWWKQGVSDDYGRWHYQDGVPIPDAYDPVRRPSHYNQHGIEAIDAIEASMSWEEFIGYLKGNVFKYLWRYRYKGAAQQDLDKAQDYLGRLSRAYAKGAPKA